MLDANIIISTIRQALPKTEAIYLFGSFADGTETPDSDVDLALLVSPTESKGLTHRELFDVQIALSDELHREVDLVNLRNVSTVFQNEIIQQGRRIFVQDVDKVEAFEVLVMALYQKLNAERAQIIRSGLESGFYAV